MITEEELRQIMEAEGYNPEEIDEACATNYGAIKDLDELAKAIQEIAENVRQACETMGKALREAFAPAAESLRQALEALAAECQAKPRQKLPRPPRYEGPQNKGRTWTRQPLRQARSSCRKMRR